MNESEVVVGAGGTTFAGPDAVKLYAAMTMRSALRMMKTGMRPNRAYTPKAVFAKVAEITGKTYKRGAYDQAIADLTVWIDTMKAAMPVREAT
jgi:hypothetical protein